jgi:hypothetical protein
MDFLKYITKILISSSLRELSGENNISATHLASFPSQQWGTKAWSFRLLQDLIQELSINKSPEPFRFCRHRLKSFFSYHRDFEAKVNLHKQLKLHGEKGGRYLIPECGPCGFDIFITLMTCSPEKVVAFDTNPTFSQCCENIYAPFSKVTIQTSASNDFNFSDYKDYLLIEPDWPHFDYSKLPLKKIKYSQKKRSDIKITSKDIYNFFNDFEAATQQSLKKQST